MQKHLVEIYRSILGDKKCIYVSCPITTGPLAVKFNEAGYADNFLFDELVVKPNIKFARWAVAELRNKYPKEVFINPAELGKVKDWTQNHYNDFWRDVIKEFAKANWLLPGWDYSVGCRLEHAMSVSLGLPIKEVVVNDKNQIRVL